ncbi:coiled-coil domain-containing protein 73-like [Rhopilema esculentum]|uniref:coiled-coil domain-containing protein 73-like n=1 Tax=Rhopilema esculentum TaxID=499914 RepID=UPI0031DEE6E2
MMGDIKLDSEANSLKQGKFSKVLKDNIIEALEELRLKRKLEEENADRINKLLKVKFDLCHEKDELHYKYEKKIKELVHKLADSERNLQETSERLGSLETRKTAHQQCENEGMKILKEEVIALQLAKHNLEKKWKEQECHYDMQTAAKESLMHQFSALQDKIKSVEEHRDQIRSELMKLESAVQKASLFQNRILRINNHQQCSLEESRAKLAKAFDEITKHKTTINKMAARFTMTSQAESVPAQKSTEPKHDLLKVKLEEQVDHLRKENERLLEELSKQTALVRQLSERITLMSNSEMGLQFEIDDLSAENLKLKDSLQTKRELAEKEIQTNEIDFNTEMSQPIEKDNEPNFTSETGRDAEIQSPAEMIEAIIDNSSLVEESVAKKEAESGTAS